MTDGLDQALVAAIFNLLAVDTGLVAFDGFVPPNTSPPYVVVYSTVDHLSNDMDNSLDGLTRVVSARWYCHCVGGSASAARAMAQRVRTQLLDVQPIVPGMSCGLLREAPGAPAPHRDEATGVLLVDAVVIYELRASV